jgi:hypothetical protein
MDSVLSVPAATAHRGSVQATLNYLAPGAGTPFVYAYDPPPGLPARNRESEARRVAIHDGRPLVRRLSLDTEGFELRRHETAVADFYDDAAVKGVYYPEVEALLRAATGAEKVVIFDHTLRNTATGSNSGPQLRLVGNQVHNDYTETSAVRRVRQLLPPAEAEARLQRRFLEINVWRSIAPTPLQAWPLALCDAQSLDWQDLVVSERRYPDRVGETYVVNFNPKHRWFYFPHMQRDEALLIKCFDSATDGRARLSVHSAFDDPTTPTDAPPRESIEVRAFVFL